MNAEFYLFDVDHGQCAALYLPNGRWCIFDVATGSQFSPVKWIADRGMYSAFTRAAPGKMAAPPPFVFLKATITHFHGDHLNDYGLLMQHGPEYLLTVIPDSGYMDDVIATCSLGSLSAVLDFAKRVGQLPSASTFPDYGGVRITEVWLPMQVVRQIGGDANARVNNSSIITRIDVYGNSILLCGDMMKEAWEAIIADQGNYGPLWRPLLSNIDILVAPHHGHSTAYSTDLMNLAKPMVVLVSAETQDPNVDSRYSQPPVRGIRIGDTTYGYISTRKNGHIKVTFQPQQYLLAAGLRFWQFGDAVVA